MKQSSIAGTNWTARVAAYEQMGLLLRREGHNALTGAQGDATHLVPAILEHAGEGTSWIYKHDTSFWIET